MEIVSDKNNLGETMADKNNQEETLICTLPTIPNNAVYNRTPDALHINMHTNLKMSGYKMRRH